MLRALDEYEIEGITTLVGFHRALLGHACFVAGETCHGVVESEELAETGGAVVACDNESTRGVGRTPAGADTPGRARRPPLRRHGARARAAATPSSPPAARPHAQRGHRGAARDAIVTPMQGTVLSVEVADGDEVEPGQVICVVEAMKMENEITSPRAGIVSELSVEPGEPVTTGQVICLVTQDAD